VKYDLKFRCVFVPFRSKFVRDQLNIHYLPGIYLFIFVTLDSFLSQLVIRILLLLPLWQNLMTFRSMIVFLFYRCVICVKHSAVTTFTENGPFQDYTRKTALFRATQIFQKVTKVVVNSQINVTDFDFFPYFVLFLSL
jgi:hypothetical protein